MYPAYEQLALEIGRGFARWRVYMHLKPPRLHFTQPREVKVWAVASELQMSPRKVRDALDWLTERGFLAEHGRDSRGVRRLTVEYEREHLPAA